jgi:AcrR family transcriptional regulator
VSWTERAADRSPTVQRSRERSVEQARHIVDAAQRLLATQGGFTTQELAKEADVALQTFYRYFGGKDELLLAVVEETIAGGCARMREGGAQLDDPLERLELYVTGVLTALDAGPAPVSRFLTAEHYRLHQVFPDELAEATRAFTDLLVPEIEAATADGRLHSADAEADAGFITQLAMSSFHHYAFATATEPIDDVAHRLWAFCLRALGR